MLDVSRFAVPLVVACVLALVASSVAAAVAVRRRRIGWPWLAPASRVLTGGAAAVVGLAVLRALAGR